MVQRSYRSVSRRVSQAKSAEQPVVPRMTDDHQQEQTEVPPETVSFPFDRMTVALPEDVPERAP
jgi:hypothetical protein